MIENSGLSLFANAGGLLVKTSVPTILFTIRSEFTIAGFTIAGSRLYPYFLALGLQDNDHGQLELAGHSLRRPPAGRASHLAASESPRP